MFQLPEPWSGHITQARVLFISSNPSIDDGSGYPRKDWHDDDIFLYSDDRFGMSIFDGAYTDPQHKYGVQYWLGTRARARELFQRKPLYGTEYALTEVVHCKSRKQVGVHAALETCVNRWLDPVLEIARTRAETQGSARA